MVAPPMEACQTLPAPVVGAQRPRDDGGVRHLVRPLVSAPRTRLAVHVECDTVVVPGAVDRGALRLWPEDAVRLCREQRISHLEGPRRHRPGSLGLPQDVAFPDWARVRAFDDGCRAATANQVVGERRARRAKTV